MRRAALLGAVPLALAVGGLAVGGLATALLTGCTVTGSSSPGRLVFDETFDGSAGSPPSGARWNAETGGGGWGNNELQSYTSRPENVALDGAGHLRIAAVREPFTGADSIARDYTSARVNTKGRFAFTYGRVEARIQVTQGQGLWPAFWLLGSAVDTAGWPACGEIDLMEMFGSDARAHASVHGPSDQPRGWTQEAASSEFTDLTQGFHTYRLDWTKGQVTVSVDGTTVLSYRATSLSGARRWAADQPMFLVLNLAVGGRVAGTPDATTPWPATMLVDSVKVWQS